MNPKSALDAFKHELLVRRVASRFVEAMEHNSPEAMKEYLKDHPNADPKNHSVKKDEGEGEGKGSEKPSQALSLEKFEAGKKKLESLANRSAKDEPPVGGTGAVSAKTYDDRTGGMTLPKGSAAFQIGRDYFRMDSNNHIQTVQNTLGALKEKAKELKADDKPTEEVEKQIKDAEAWVDGARTWQQDQFLEHLGSKDIDLDASPEKHKATMEKHLAEYVKSDSKKKNKSFLREIANMSPDDFSMML